MKTIALYLPQFHECEDNNRWWGKGFTEWTNVRKAVPLFEGHNQPREPLNLDYYDLSDKSVMLRQMNLAKSHGIDGFCFYHYWFCGKKILERPIENLWNEENIPLPFMLCWANEPWTRTWDGDFGAKQILIDQTYGDIDDWKNHFFYLLKFFRMDAYIKIDGKPVIAIYRSSNIKKRREMFSLWEEMAKENGFSNGLYILNTHKFSIEKEIPIYGDGIYDFEPFISMQYVNRNEMGRYRRGFDGEEYFTLDYIKICEHMIERKIFGGEHHNLGFFTGFDNSPRIGKRVKILYENNSPEIVEKYFRIQYQRSVDLGNEFLFINAWNEWAEGAILEPDNLYGYGYLEAIKRAVDNV